MPDYIVPDYSTSYFLGGNMNVAHYFGMECTITLKIILN